MTSCRHNFFMLNISKTDRYTALISIEDMPEIIYAESNGHLADDVVRTYDITVVSNW